MLQYKFAPGINLLLIGIFSLICTDSISQKSPGEFKYLDSIIAAQGRIIICKQETSHPVDIEAKLLLDSLKTIGVDTMLMYRHWLGTNGFNGYGKVLWREKGSLKQYRINFINNASGYGIESMVLTTLDSDSIFSFYFDNNIKSVTTNPTEQKIWMSHDSDHFVYAEINKETYCFNISGLLVEYNPMHLRSRLVEKLMLNSQIGNVLK